MSPPSRLMAAFLAAAGLIFSASPHILPGQVYTIRDLGTQFGHPTVIAMDLNDKGQVTGNTVNAAETIRRAFVISPPYTSMTFLGAYEDYTSSYGSDINNAGVVVGHTDKVSEPVRMLIWSNGVFSSYPPPPGETSGFLEAINDHGVMAGRAGSNAFTIENGRMTTLPPLIGNNFAISQSINISGVVVGYCSSGLGARATAWINGVPDELADLGGVNSHAFHIADNGLIVGASQQPNSASYRAYTTRVGEQAVNLGSFSGGSEAYGSNGIAVVGYSNSPTGLKAILYENDEMKDLNELIPQGTGWTLWSARAINAYGQIVGYGGYNGQTRGFLLTPINPIGGAADWIFTERDNGWTAATNIPPFEPAEAEWLPGLGYGMRATGFPSFGFLQSPEVPLRPARTYRLWVIVANTASTPNTAPQIRLRAFQTGNNQASFLALDSVSNVLPSGAAGVYEFTFSPYFSGALPVYRFYLDFTYFNPDDEQDAWVYLQRVILAED